MTEPDHQSLFQLPELAGLCTVLQATKSKDWSAQESVRRWKRVHYCLKQVGQALVDRITSQPIFELKLLFSHHAYLLSEQVTTVRTRVSEMREPPLGLDKVPHPGLQRMMDDLSGMNDLSAFLHACYQCVLPEVLVACQGIQSAAHPVADAPSVRAAKLITFELQELIQTGQAACQAIDQAIQLQAGETSPDIICQNVNLPSWLAHLQQCLESAGGLDGTHRLDDQSATVPDAYPNDLPFTYSGLPKRDSRFRDSYNAGVNAEAFLYDQRFSPQDKTLMMYYKRIREIDVPETMASILVELRDQKPWEFHCEMLRQLWDEARHAMMGQIGFASLGIDWTQIPINFTWSLNLNTQLDASQRHGVLFFIEQGLMARTGKRYEWEVSLESQDSLAALFQDFDWADEVLHAQIGRRWYVPQFASLQEALRFGDQAWSTVMSHWLEYQQQQLTSHRNWWPDLYRLACQKWNKQPDPAALAFDTSYQASRADLKGIGPPAEKEDN